MIKRYKLWIVLLVLVMLVVACQPSTIEEETVPIIDSVAPLTTREVSLPKPTSIPGAQEAPDFALPDLDGQTWTLAQFKDQPVMLFFWASW